MITSPVWFVTRRCVVGYARFGLPNFGAIASNGIKFPHQPDPFFPGHWDRHRGTRSGKGGSKNGCTLSNFRTKNFRSTQKRSCLTTTKTLRAPLAWLNVGVFSESGVQAFGFHISRHVMFRCPVALNGRLSRFGSSRIRHVRFHTWSRAAALIRFRLAAVLIGALVRARPASWSGIIKHRFILPSPLPPLRL